MDVPDGTCFLVAGESIPVGATTSYSVHGGYGGHFDDMAIAVVDSSSGCDPTSADIAYGIGVGTVTTSGSVATSSSYNLAIFCWNPLTPSGAAVDCLPTVDYWTWDDPS